VALVAPASMARARANLTVAAAVAGLVCLAIVYSPRTSFPGINALLVCLLAAMAIRYGANSTLLSSRWIVHVGRRSYSIYLWHWPVVALAGYLNLRDAGSLAANLLLLVPIYALSALSYSLVERPGIRLQYREATSLALFAVIPLLFVVSTLPVLRSHDGFPARLGPEAERVFQTLKSFKRDRERCNDLGAGADIERCALGDLQASDRALLLGDSHAQHYWAFVDVLARQAHVKVYGLTNGECLALDGARLIRNAVPYVGCAEATRAHYEMIARDHFRFVFLAQRWIGYPEAQLEHLNGSIDAIVASGAIPVILKPVAENGRNPARCFFRHIKLRQSIQDDCGIAVDNDFVREKKRFVDVLIERARKRHPRLLVIDIQRVQCEGAECATTIDGTPIYSDLHHLNDYGSDMLAQRTLQLLGSPLTARATAHPDDPVVRD